MMILDSGLLFGAGHPVYVTYRLYDTIVVICGITEY